MLGVDAAAAGLTVHETIRSRRHSLLLAADGKPLVVEKSVGAGRLLVIANGSFLLNEGVVNPARRPLAEHVLDWVTGASDRVAMVDGPSVLGDAEGMPSLWDLLWRIPPLRWVAIQMGLAALLAALARAPRLGRPRPDPSSGADRPAEHAVAFGALWQRLERLAMLANWSNVTGDGGLLTRRNLDCILKAEVEWMRTSSILQVRRNPASSRRGTKRVRPNWPPGAVRASW